MNKNLFLTLAVLVAVSAPASAAITAQSGTLNALSSMAADGSGQYGSDYDGSHQAGGRAELAPVDGSAIASAAGTLAPSDDKETSVRSSHIGNLTVGKSSGKKRGGLWSRIKNGVKKFANSALACLLLDSLSLGLILSSIPVFLVAGPLAFIPMVAGGLLSMVG